MVHVSYTGGRRSPKHFTFEGSHIWRRTTDQIVPWVIVWTLAVTYFLWFGVEMEGPSQFLRNNGNGIPEATTAAEGFSQPKGDEKRFFASLDISEKMRDPQNTDALSLSKQTKGDESNSDYPPVVIAHVISLIKCAKEASVTGLLDSAAVLRHSIHLTSVHTNNPHTGKPVSRYSYQMYAIVHSDHCAHHAPVLEGIGYKVLLRHTPVNVSEIENEFYQNHARFENLDELIKVYSYTLLDHPISVQWDLDVLVLQPLDDLYDSMLFDEDDPQGQAARASLKLSHPQQRFPSHIDAFYTMDDTSSQHWELGQDVQVKFFVTRPSQSMFHQFLEFITEGSYVEGWVGSGFRRLRGSGAYQDASTYMYNILNPGHVVALDVCVYHQVVADFPRIGEGGIDHQVQCRQYSPHDYTFANNTVEYSACEDCATTPLQDTITVRYTACSKPWQCIDPKPRASRDNGEFNPENKLRNQSTCYRLFAEWFRVRWEFEALLLKAFSGTLQLSPHDGAYFPSAFGGYCRGPGQYIPMLPPPLGFDVGKLYGM